MDFRTFFRELKRRHTYRWGVAYLVTAWLILQVASLLFSTFAVAPVYLRGLTLLLGVGFPIALALAWFYEITPSGIRKTAPEGAETPRSVLTQRRVTRIVVSVLVATIILLVLERILNPAAPAAATVLSGGDRVAVLPFENKTGNPELDPVGEFTADWLLTQIMRLDSVDVVTLPTVKTHLAYAGTSNNPDIVNSFYERTGAEKLIRGSYYLLGDSLAFNCQVEDVRDNRVVLALPTIKGTPDNISETVASVTARVLTFLHLDRYDPVALNTFYLQSPPKYIAYQTYLQANQYFGEHYDRFFPLIKQAIAEDPDFFFAYLQYGFALSNLSRLAELDSLIRVIEREVPLQTRYQRLYFEYLRQGAARNRDKKLAAIREIFQIDPKQIVNNYLAGINTLGINRPREAIEIFAHIEPALVPVTTNVETWWFHYYAYAYLRLGDNRRAKEILAYIPDDYRYRLSYQLLARAHIQAAEHDSIEVLFTQLEQQPYAPERLARFACSVAFQYGLYDPGAGGQQVWADRAQRYYDQATIADLGLSATIAYLRGNWREASRRYEKLMAGVDTPPWWYLAPLSYCYFQLDERDSIAMLEQRVAEVVNRERYPNDYLQLMAILKTHQGEPGEAMRWLRRAFREDLSFEFGLYDDCFELLPLHGYPPFEEFVRPRTD